MVFIEIRLNSRNFCKVYLKGRGGLTKIEIAFFRQLMLLNCADMHFTQKFQQNNHSFSFYGQFYTRVLAHDFFPHKESPEVSLGYCDVNNWNLAQQNCTSALMRMFCIVGMCRAFTACILIEPAVTRHSEQCCQIGLKFANWATFEAF